MKRVKWVCLVVLLVVLYLVTAVPVGMMIYAVKSSWGYDVFSDTGFHAIRSCLNEAYLNQM